MTGITLLVAGCFLKSNVTTSCSVTKIVSSDNTAQFLYSSSGLLTNINNSNTWNVTVGYNGTQKVAKLEFYNHGTDTLDFYSDFTEASNSQIEQASYEMQNGSWVQQSKTVFDLNSNGDIEKASYFEKLNNNFAKTSYDDYTWENGNVTKAEDFVLSGGNFEKRYTTTYQYDNKANALQNLSIKSVDVITAYYWYTKNNPVKMVTVDNKAGTQIYSATFEYQYNSDNLPISYTRTDSLASGNTQVYTVSSITYSCK